MGKIVILARYRVHLNIEHENLVSDPSNNKSIICTMIFIDSLQLTYMQHVPLFVCICINSNWTYVHALMSNHRIAALQKLHAKNNW